MPRFHLGNNAWNQGLLINKTSPNKALGMLGEVALRKWGSLREFNLSEVETNKQLTKQKFSVNFSTREHFDQWETIRSWICIRCLETSYDSPRPWFSETMVWYGFDGVYHGTNSKLSWKTNPRDLFIVFCSFPEIKKVHKIRVDVSSYIESRIHGLHGFFAWSTFFGNPWRCLASQQNVGFGYLVFKHHSCFFQDLEGTCFAIPISLIKLGKYS